MKTRNVAKVIREYTSVDFQNEVSSFIEDKDIISVSAYRDSTFNHCALIIYREFV